MCGVGVAFNARLGGIRMFGASNVDAVEAASFSHRPQHVDIYSMSWGPDDTGAAVDGPRELGTKALKNGKESTILKNQDIFVEMM